MKTYSEDVVNQTSYASLIPREVKLAHKLLCQASFMPHFNVHGWCLSLTQLYLHAKNKTSPF